MVAWTRRVVSLRFLDSSPQKRIVFAAAVDNHNHNGKERDDEPTPERETESSICSRASQETSSTHYQTGLLHTLPPSTVYFHYLAN